MASKKIQLYTDRANTIEASPETSASCVILSDGNDLQKVLDNDLTTPTVVHEETSFKVGVGDINVSPSVVDGEASRMVIKGKTYQNILPEPSLRNSMSKGKTMQKFNEGYDNVNVVDGVSKSAILKGQTLVNIVQGNMRLNCGDSSRFSDIVSRPNYLSAKISSSLVGTWTYVSCKIDLQLLKPNAKYFVKFEQLSGIHDGMSIGVRRGDGQKPLTDNVKAKSSVILTTLSQLEIDNQVLYIGIPSSAPVGTTIVVSNPILIEYQEGMENWDIPYFEGMKSVESPVVKMVGKNLFSKDKVDFNKLYHTEVTEGKTGTLQNAVNLRCFTIRLKQNTNYTISLGFATGTLRVFATKEYPVVGTKATMIIRKPGATQATFNTGNWNYFTVVYYSYNSDNTSGKTEDETIATIQLEEGAQVTPYEPFKTNILHTPEEVVLREVNGVRDTLNLMTGEYVQRIGEVVLDGTSVLALNKWEFGSDCTEFNFNAKGIKGDGVTLSNFAKSYLKSNRPRNIETVSSNNLDNTFVLITIQKSKLVTDSVEGMNQYLQSNPITIQYELKTPIVKTVDLSSSGNWEKVVLDGSEDEKWLIAVASNGVGKYFVLNSVCTPNLPHATNTNAFCDKFPYVRFSALDDKGFGFNSSYGLRFHIEEVNIYKGATVEDFRQYLSQNPITVWYQTTTHQNSTQVKQLLSFSNGHIQLSSEEGSLIPSLDYEVSTNNSYHMDLMKAGTYTIKSDFCSGIMYIGGDDLHFGLATNRTIDLKQSQIDSLPNNLWYFKSHSSFVNGMVLEGDLTSKTIPYFKGIKSAFEDESKIEVLSIGKNLWDNKVFKDCPIATINDDGSVTLNGKLNYHWMFDYMIDKGTYYASAIGNDTGYIHLFWGGGDEFFHKSKPFTISEKVTRRGYVASGTYENAKVYLQLEQGIQATPYQPYKSNITKIPLSSPLRSLPNGICDEVILDRENNKVKMIQRVGKVILDGSERWQRESFNFVNKDFLRFITYLTNVKTNGKGLCDKLPVLEGDKFGVNYIRPSIDRTWIYKADLTVTTDSFVRELSNDPLMLHYELRTPIITEIDLDGYPYIYKDGHIFLNSEIAPVVEINYNVNQSQQIQSNNETLQRHELDILDLDNLIISFVNAEYKLRLLKFDMELSMMALDE